MSTYRYTECGLDNVLIEGMKPCTDDHGEAVYYIQNPVGLHKVIAAGIVQHPKGISGKELRFLRTEMGMTQAELGKLLHRDAQTIARWEKGTSDIEGTAEMVVRKHAIEMLLLTVGDATVTALSERCVPGAGTQQIVIEGQDPEHYLLRAA